MKSNSFVVHIRTRQNESWQGSVEWIEGHRIEHFRSALELIKLVDSAVNSDKKAKCFHDLKENDEQRLAGN